MHTWRNKCHVNTVLSTHFGHVRQTTVEVLRNINVARVTPFNIMVFTTTTCYYWRNTPYRLSVAACSLLYQAVCSFRQTLVLTWVCGVEWWEEHLNLRGRTWREARGFGWSRGGESSGSCWKNRNDTSCCDKDLKGKVYVVDLETHGNIKMELQEAGWEDATWIVSDSGHKRVVNCCKRGSESDIEETYQQQVEVYIYTATPRLSYYST